MKIFYTTIIKYLYLPAAKRKSFTQKRFPSCHKLSVIKILHINSIEFMSNIDITLITQEAPTKKIMIYFSSSQQSRLVERMEETRKEDSSGESLSFQKYFIV